MSRKCGVGKREGTDVPSCEEDAVPGEVLCFWHEADLLRLIFHGYFSEAK
jgi:hypothetical protein